MEPFKFLRAENNEGAIIASLSGNTKYVAGGTNLLDLMKLYIETPGKIVDINKLPLNKVEELPDGGLRKGARVKNRDWPSPPLSRKKFPGVTAAGFSGA